MTSPDYLKLIIASILGFVVVFGGFEATHSFLSYAVTIPLSAVIGYVIGRWA